MIFVATWPIAADAQERQHGIAMHGSAQLPADFSHFPYANPQAPKGGVFRQAVTGGFDSVNPFIIKGVSAVGVRKYTFENLLARNRSEPFTLYGLIAQSIEVPDDRTSITFHINPKARFSDGRPVTARDVVFSHATLRDKGRPNHRAYYKKVLKVETPDDLTVTFKLDGTDLELPLILGLMPILPAHVFETRAFEKTTLKPIVGSGPYVIDDVKPGESIVFRRDPNYWGRDLPVNQGLWNFDSVRFDYYRDNQSAFEALKKNLVNFRLERDPGRWSQGYDFPAVASGELIRETVPKQLPKPVASLVINTRRAIFADVRVRQALQYAFDFEWANKNLFHNLFQRTQGYFDGSILSSVGRPASRRERALLKSLDVRLPADILDGSYRQPVSSGSGHNRKNLRAAVDLFKQAGWVITDGKLVHGESKEPFEFELTVATREQERIALNYQRGLRQIGITVTVRQVDSAQFQRRLQTYDFDMLPFTWYNSLSPGNEQAFYWGSRGRTQEGTRNYMGADSTAIDKTIAAMLRARSSEDFTAAVRVLDRLLIVGHYTVPLYHAPGDWIARWDDLARPRALSLYGLLPEALWSLKP